MKNTYVSLLTIFNILGLLVILIARVIASIICGTSRIKSPLKKKFTE